MNINSRINWQVGMELTEQTLKGHDAAIEGRIAALRSALHSGQFGLLPGTTYYNNPSFVKRTIEIANLRCMALLRSGEIIHIDENVEIPITMLYEDLYYVAVSLDEDNLIQFDNEGVPMVRPSNRFTIVEPSQLAEDTTLFPIVKLCQSNGSFEIDTNFAPPVVVIGSSPRLMELLGSVVSSVEHISSHENLEPGDATLAIQRLLFNIKTIGADSLLSDVISRMRELLQTLDYYILKPNSLVLPQSEVAVDLNDIEVWFSWFASMAEWIAGAMERVTLVDHSIDYERLKGELYDQLSQMAREELYKQMYEQLSTELREEVARDVKAPLMSFINGEVRQELYAELERKLMSDLEEKLSPELYDKLYAALYVEPEKEADDFVPVL